VNPVNVVNPVNGVQMAERLSDKVDEYLESAQGRIVNLKDIRTYLVIEPGSSDDANLRKLLGIRVKQRVVSPSGKNDGFYKVVKKVQPVKVFSVSRERRTPIDLYFPRDFTTEMEMEFAENIVLREGDLITIGGVKSTGKTQFALNLCAENIDKHPVLMGNEYTVEVDGISEPSPRFLSRLDKMSEWVNWTDETGEDKFTLLPVHDDFAEHVVPGRLNIMDWINLDGNALYDIGKVLKDIKTVNGRGISIAMLQKSESSTNARGGQFVRDFSDLEITLDPFGKNSYDVLLTIKGCKEAKKSIVGNTYTYTIGEAGTKIFNFRKVKKCNGCGGTGKYKGTDCDRCLGTGWQQ
jgi:hypothetical protein